MDLIVRPMTPAETSLWKRLFKLRLGGSPAGMFPRRVEPNSYTLEAYGHSDTGCVRPNNEDYFRIEPQAGFYAVADGVGGAGGGEYASRLAVDTVAEQVVSARRRDTQLLVSAMEEANRRVAEAAQSAPKMAGMGSTLLVGLLQNQDLYITSVGDSRVYLLDDEGLRPITQDQSWMEEVGRHLGLDEESLRRHPMRNVLTMAIGHGAPLAVKTYTVRLRPSATLMLCTDGLHGVVNHAEIERILRDRSDDRLETTCRKLVDAARSAGGPDNIAVVLVRPVFAKNENGNGLRRLQWHWWQRQPVCQTLFDQPAIRGYAR
jgi:protein phosphatase